MLNPVFSILFASGFLFLLVCEIVGIIRKNPGDTITENWRYIDGHLNPILQWGWRILTAGLLTWTLFHFAGNWG
jgi:hypothetical protein